MKIARLTIAITAALFGPALLSGAVFAKGPPVNEASQNLSVPTIMVGTAAGNLNCGTLLLTPTALVPPPGPDDPGYLPPLDGYTGPADNPLNPADYYWVQKVHTWQAQCLQAGDAQVFGAWGDNLEGDAKLKVGSPIRVEIVLHNLTAYPELTPLKGYTVIKLEDLLDRESDYGHLAGVDAEGGFFDIPTEFPDVGYDLDTRDPTKGWLVHDSQITFSVQNLDTGAYAVDPGSNPTAEINATGKVVYGYNLRVGEPGLYQIVFTTSALVHFLDQDAVNGGVEDLDGDGLYEQAWININVVGGGGKGKGKPSK